MAVVLHLVNPAIALRRVRAMLADCERNAARQGGSQGAVGQGAAGGHANPAYVARVSEGGESIAYNSIVRSIASAFARRSTARAASFPQALGFGRMAGARPREAIEFIRSCPLNAASKAKSSDGLKDDLVPVMPIT